MTTASDGVTGDADVGHPRLQDAPEIIVVDGVTKRYGAVCALDGINFRVHRGTIHALVGENGSGKSTLMKLIAGVIAADGGSIAIDGQALQGADPHRSIELGVRVIYQDLALFPNMTVAENIAFDGSAGLLHRVNRREALRHARQALRELNVAIDPLARLGDLSTAERQLVAIARATSSEGRIILMDEPTAALTHDEIEDLLATVRRLNERGLTFVFVSHKLREVVEIADAVTIVRDGQLIATGPAADYDEQRITALMTGGDVVNVRRDAPVAGQPVVDVRGLTLGQVFQDIDLALHPGRVLGLAGLMGSGRIEIGLAVAGLIRAERGTIRYHGRPVRSLRANRRVQYVPEDRLTQGLYLDWTIADNVVVSALNKVLAPIGLVSGRKINALGEQWNSALRIKAPTAMATAASLSGGNQQRVLLARSLAPGPEVVILNNPTVGVDIGSRADIHDLVRRMADNGAAVLLVSDEPAELISLSDDITLVRKGKVAGQYAGDTLSADDLAGIISMQEVA